MQPTLNRNKIFHPSKSSRHYTNEMSDLPVVGAALRLERIEDFKDWILDQQRDLELQDPSFDFPSGKWQNKAELWHDAMSGYTGRMGVHGPYDGIALASRDPEVQSFVQHKLIDCLEFCEAISASHCVIHSPFHYLGGGVTCHTPTFGLEGMLRSARETLAPVIEKAESIGCLLVMENIFDRNPAPLRALIDSIDSPFLKRSIDTGHAQIAYKSANGASPEFSILEAGADLAHLHLQDTNGENDYHWTPGLGDINWAGVFDAIAKTKSKPRLIIEVKDVVAAWQYFTDNKLAL